MGERKTREEKAGEGEGEGARRQQGAEERRERKRQLELFRWQWLRVQPIHSPRAPLSGAWAVWAGLLGCAGSSGAQLGAQAASTWALPPIVLSTQLGTWVSVFPGGARETVQHSA